MPNPSLVNKSSETLRAAVCLELFLKLAVGVIASDLLTKVIKIY